MSNHMSDGANLNITVIGLGYVGLIGSAVLAHLGHQVKGVDIDRNKLQMLQSGQPTLLEPGLEELLTTGLESGSLTFAHVEEVDVGPRDVVMIAVGTPSSVDGSADLSQVMGAVRWVLDKTWGPTVLIMKSSVPPGTGNYIVGHELSDGRIGYVSNPEFLREGRAVHDWLHPDRIVVGAKNPEDADKVESIYSGIDASIVLTDVTSAEMIKYASNALLVTKISFINEIAALCDLLGGHIGDVAHGVGLDPRLGPDFLKAGLGWGGSCFPKDVRALQALALKNHRSFDLLTAVVSVNQKQRLLPVQALKEEFGNLDQVPVAVLGLTFKPGTDDLREAPSFDVISGLLAEGAQVRAYDPVAVEAARSTLPRDVSLSTNVRETLEGAQAAVLVTEWPEIVALPWDQVASWMDMPRYLFDGRNALDEQVMKDLGFDYRSIGRANLAKEPRYSPSA